MAEYITGFFTKKPSEKAPQFIKAKVSIKKQDFINWLHTQESEWVNIDILESQKGEFYGKVDDWKPNTQGEQKNSTTGQNGLNNEEVKQIQELRGEPKGISVPPSTLTEAFDEIDPSSIPF